LSQESDLPWERTAPNKESPKKIYIHNLTKLSALIK
jgi:hypothetical protein